MDYIRKAVHEDLDAITDIYNSAVRSGFATAEMTEVSPESMFAWFACHVPDTHPVFVYETGKQVVGWLSISPYRQGREAVKYTVEVSYYIHENFRGRGIGSRLLECAIAESRKMGYKTLFAIVIDKNAGSTRLLRNYGFEEWGRMPNVVDFDGVECDHVYYGLRL